MKTEKEIMDRIKWHQDNRAKIMKLKENAQVKFFKSVEMISMFQEQIEAEEVIISVLSWVLVS